MPATFLLLPAAVIGLVAWLAAWWYTRRTTGGPHDELQRLRNQAMWLEQRLDLARRERWDHEMIAHLSDELGEACQRLARARSRLRNPAHASAR